MYNKTSIPMILLQYDTASMSTCSSAYESVEQIPEIPNARRSTAWLPQKSASVQQKIGIMT